MNSKWKNGEPVNEWMECAQRVIIMTKDDATDTTSGKANF